MRSAPRRRNLLSAALLLAASLQAIPALASKIPVKEMTSQTRAIRVRIAEAVATAKVSGYDLRLSEARGDHAKSADRESRWEVHCQDGRIRATRTDADEEGQTVVELREPAVIRSPAGFVKVQDRPYRDVVKIYSAGSFCEVVNEAPLEKYLEGVVNAEFNSKWNEDALEAQIVAARTYALYQIRSASEKAHFDVDATVNDQVYDGSMKEDFRATQAVKRTAGLVLTVNSRQGPAPVKAFYHSTCGGLTELPENVWGVNAPGVGHVVKCPYCADSPRFHWDTDLRASEIADAFLRGGRVDGAQPGWSRGWVETVRRGTLLSVRPLGLDISGRVKELRTEWRVGGPSVSETRTLDVAATKFREWIGPARFRSTAFQVFNRSGLFAGAWHFEGRGNGHGVGMCQWGAKTMGEKGIKMAEILRHYYPDAILRKLW